MHVVGIDLAGPAGSASTGIAVFSPSANALRFVAQQCDGSDLQVHALAVNLSRNGPVVIGVDAPLSYEPGGGQRHRDRELRSVIVSRGMRPGSVMAPTAPRMVYLTLRGIALATALSAVPSVRVVEVHPGAALCLRGAPLGDVMSFAHDEGARERLLSWFASHGLHGVTSSQPCVSHFVAACAAAIAAWDWASKRPAWHVRADPPWHPYDFAC